MRHALRIGVAAALLAAAPAGADVKTGVDAWAKGDYRTAVEEWRGPAVAGDPDAQFNLGQAYKLGRGVPVDPGLAESWFRKAALQKHAQAEDNYGLSLYQSGRKGEAVPWLEKSVARGEPRAQLVLGTMLFNGDGVGRDVPRAYALMTRASGAGLTSASQTLAQMDGYITPADRQKGTALAAQMAATQQAMANGSVGRTVVGSEGPRPAGPAPMANGTGSRTGTPPRSSSPVVANAPATRPTPVRAASAKPTPAPTPTPDRSVAARPAPSTRPTPAPAPKPARQATVAPAQSGRYRVQLGAFKDPGNARDLWARVGGRIGGSPSYTKAGGLTRLIAGGFATEAAAQRACRSAGVTCLVMR